jgi:hypothetical protein
MQQPQQNKRYLVGIAYAHKCVCVCVCVWALSHHELWNAEQMRIAILAQFLHTTTPAVPRLLTHEHPLRCCCTHTHPRYLAVRNAIVAKRATSGVDDAVLDMTTGLLGILPDFMTMWNWRREGLTLKWQG